MRISASNLCTDKPIAEFLQVMKANGLDTVELALTKAFGCPWSDITESMVEDLDRTLRDAGMRCCSFQSVMFGCTANIFDNPDEVSRHLGMVMRYARMMGVHYLVFGSPKNRLVTEATAIEAGAKMFRDLLIANPDMTIGFEANPSAYGCNFGTTFPGAKLFIDLVGVPTFVFHLDLGCSVLGPYSIAEAFEYRLPTVLHVSEPKIGGLCTTLTIEDHRNFAEYLRSNKYYGVISLETLSPSTFERDIATMVEVYA